MKFKVGDKVILHRPKDLAEWPGWYSAMAHEEGKELIIKETFSRDNKKAYKVGTWWCNEKWLSLYDEEPFEGNV